VLCRDQTKRPNTQWPLFNFRESESAHGRRPLGHSVQNPTHWRLVNVPIGGPDAPEQLAAQQLGIASRGVIQVRAEIVS
jgi:hypothetical protein